MADTLDTVKNSTLETSRAKKMPSTSNSQARLMAAAAHTPGGYGGVPQKVGQDFNKADTGTQRLKDAMRERSARHQATESMAEKQMEKRMGRP